MECEEHNNNKHEENTHMHTHHACKILLWGEMSSNLDESIMLQIDQCLVKDQQAQSQIRYHNDYFTL